MGRMLQCATFPLDPIAAADIRLMYVIYNKPESFRGSFPPGVKLPTLTSDQSSALNSGILPHDLIPSIKSVKNALGLTSRP